MKLNVAKSSVMWFGSKVSVTEQISVVYVGDIPLKPVSTQKYLGVVFDNQLRWDSHVSTVCKKISYYLLSHYKHMPNDVIKLLIDSLVLSRLTYALPVWGPAISKQCLTRLQRQYNWAVHIVKNLKKFDHVSAHCTELGWLPVDALICYRTLCTMHQLYHRTFTLLNPSILFGPQHTYSTRCSRTFANTMRWHLSQTQSFFVIRVQNGGMHFLSPLLLHVTFHLFIIIYCI